MLVCICCHFFLIKLHQMRFRVAIVRGAIVRGAIVQGAIVRGGGGDCPGGGGAIVRGAIVQGAIVRGAIVRGAIVWGAIVLEPYKTISTHFYKCSNYHFSNIFQYFYGALKRVRSPRAIHV